jgi:hypothetical protein
MLKPSVEESESNLLDMEFEKALQGDGEYSISSDQLA